MAWGAWAHQGLGAANGKDGISLKGRTSAGTYRAVRKPWGNSELCLAALSAAGLGLCFAGRWHS